MWQLRMHCNLRPPDAEPVLFCFHYNAMPRVKSLNLSTAVFQLLPAFWQQLKYTQFQQSFPDVIMRHFLTDCGPSSGTTTQATLKNY